MTTLSPIRPREVPGDGPPRCEGDEQGSTEEMQMDDESERKYSPMSPGRNNVEIPEDCADEADANDFGFMDIMDDDGNFVDPGATPVIDPGGDSSSPNLQKPESSDGNAGFECIPCDGRVPITLRCPMKPSKEDVEKHNPTHLPYRNWCSVCVAAKGKEDAHKRDRGAERTGLPVVSIDYSELDDETNVHANKTLVVKDEESGGLLHYKVKMKGPGDEWLVKKVISDLAEFGRTDIRLKSDGEPAIVALQAKIQELRKHKTLLINPPAYNPQANGGCEKGVQDVTAQTRALKLGLESRLGVEIADDDKVLEWIYVHAAFLLTRFEVGHDGMTAWERLTGTKWHRPVLEIGEVVLAKLATRRAGRIMAKQKRKLTAKSIKAVWVGQVSRTGEHVVIAPSGDAVRCRTVFRVPIDERWDRDLVKAIQGTPRVPAPSRKNSDELKAPLIDDKPAQARRNPKSESMVEGQPGESSGAHLQQPETRGPRPFEHRRFRIDDRLIQKYGTSDDCKGCDAKRHGLPAELAGGRTHTQACRQRFMDCMAADEKDKEIIGRDDEKFRDVAVQPDAQPAEQPPHKLEQGCEAPEIGERPKPDDSQMSEITSPDCPDVNNDNPDGIPELDEDAMQTDDEGKDEPNTKRQRLGQLLKRPPLQTALGRALAGQTTDEDVAEETLACLNAIGKIRNRADVRQILKDLDDSPKLQLRMGRKQRRSVQADGKHDVSEVYSPPRMAKAAAALGLRDGWSLDLTTSDESGQPWDFSKLQARTRAMALVKADKPFLLVCSPMCGPFSELQELFNYPGKPTAEVKEKLEAGLMHVKFCLELCVEQYQQGRAFMFEHPAGASTWYTDMIQQVATLPGVEIVKFDFCVLGMTAPDVNGKDGPVRKRTSVMTNSPSIQLLLREARCHRQHKHTHLLNGLAKGCEVYTEQFCRLVCEGVRRDMDNLKWRDEQAAVFDISSPFGKLMKLQERAEQLMSLGGTRTATGVCPPEEDPFSQIYDGMEFYDDVTGEPLEKKEAVAARKLEIEFFKKKGVYTKVRRQSWMKVITTRWLDTNKGDKINKNYRSRLVGREIKRDKREDLFAATPPLESLRMILSICASHRNSQHGADDYIVMTNDVKRAYFHAPATRPIYVKIPLEDHEEGDDDMVGQLNLSLYGTRDAAQNWSRTVAQIMASLGFIAGQYSPCNFRHPSRGIAVTVHGDDFTSTGREADLRWLDGELRKRLDIKTELLGPDPARHKQQVRVLNRVITWQEDGLIYEADQRHVEILIRELNLEHAKAVATPGTREEAIKASMVEINARGEVQVVKEDDKTLMSPRDATRYRALAARANYLAQDRPEAQYAIKEIARRMASPNEEDWGPLKRLTRYLIGSPRAKFHYYWQHMPRYLDAFVDSDWAGCKGTSRSTSGGAAKIGYHTIKTWSTTQAVIALSSGEAELYAMTKGAAVALGLSSLAADFGLELHLNIHTDASAAVGIVNRQGVGKLRHIRVQYLWVQSKVQDKEISIHKVNGKLNPADLMTKNLAVNDMQRHLETLCIDIGTDRANIAPQLAKVATTLQDDNDDNDHDDWIQDADYAVRVHNKSRLTLFTPLRVRKAPPARSLATIRTTEGAYCDDGEEFKVVDSWTSRSTAHRPMARRWTGTTTFAMRRSE